ncbi:MAG: UDP-N-acetylmuramoyl-tripeptide--D-alanyl-D-alanine ligase [Acidobacteriota bacterium]|nr:UDP-N-acetylmuramoyl-tripeptide--D-alanyl-D-alanine ligase [Acidobacteriota bacterium]
MQGELDRVDPDACFEGAALDSRRIAGGELFFALEGEQTDGHRFVADAIECGAAAAVVERGVDLGGARLPVVRVDDCFEALHELTRHVRDRVPERLIGVTGSAGKTTTKDLLAAMLAERFRTASTPGNLNNLYGFPLALLGVPDDAEWMVAEMGMSEPGELGRVSRLGRPNIVLLSNIRPAHLGSFDSVTGVAEAKAEIFEGLTEGGLVVANADDPEVVRVAERERQRSGCEIAWFSLAGVVAEFESPTLRVSGLECPVDGRPGSRFTLAAGDARIEVSLLLPGRHNVENFLAAATTAHRVGVTLEEIARAVESAGPAPMRGVVHYVGGDARVFDDSYNSNPDALTKTLQAASELPARRHWAVIGEMLELGRRAPEFHRLAGAEAVRLGFDPIVGVGELARGLVAAAKEAGADARWIATADEAAAVAATELAGGDLVLVKGSRGVGLEVVVERLVRPS